MTEEVMQSERLYVPVVRNLGFKWCCPSVPAEHNSNPTGTSAARAPAWQGIAGREDHAFSPKEIFV